jgi:hypothetical protein
MKVAGSVKKKPNIKAAEKLNEMSQRQKDAMREMVRKKKGAGKGRNAHPVEYRIVKVPGRPRVMEANNKDIVFKPFKQGSGKPKVRTTK